MPDFQPPELSVTLNCIALLTGTLDATILLKHCGGNTTWESVLRSTAMTNFETNSL